MLSTKFSLIKNIISSNTVKPLAEIDISLYKHETSGLKVLISSDTHSTPIFNLSIVVPTLAHDNSGLPHTLEHLIFLGSELYPQKGYLDRLATMGTANGTNAYTSEDHTCYTLSTASPEGLLGITPVFLDHVLRPLLKDEEFIAEVWDGDDRGVVYSEMRGREWTEGDQQAGLLGQLLAEHNATFNPYKWECGGRTPVIRELEMQDIKRYHEYWYNTKNVIVQLSGPISKELCGELLQKISTLLDTFPITNCSPTLPTALNTDKMLYSIQDRQARIVEANFPAEDESQCSVALAWDLTSYSEKDLIALGILSKYLKDTSGSPLNHHFTQNPDNIICSTVDIDIKWWLGNAMFMSFSGIDNSKSATWNKAHVIAKELEKVLEDLVHNLETCSDAKATFMKEITVALNNYTLNILERAEDDPHELAFSFLLPELLKSSHLKTEFTGNHWTESAVILHNLRQANDNFWLELLKKFKGLQPVGEVLLKPSQTLSDNLKTNKKNISNPTEQKQASNIELIKIPTIKATSQLIKDAIQHRDIKIENSTGCLQLVTIKSSFNHVVMGINIESIIIDYPELLPYFVLFQELFGELDVDVKLIPGFETSILEGRIYSYQEIQSLLQQSFSSVSSGIGFDAGNSSPFVIGYQENCLVTTATGKTTINPDEIVNILLNILLNSVYSEDRIDVTLEQLKESLVDGQRDPGVVSDSILMQLICKQERKNGGKRVRYSDRLAIFEACGLFKQHQLLKNLNAKDVIDKLMRIQDLIRDIVTKPNEEKWNMFLQIGTPNQFPQFKGLNGKAFPSEGVRGLSLNFVQETAAIVLPMRDLTASHMYLTVACPEILKDPTNTDCLIEFLACSVLCHLMSMLEGPLYRAVRGAGLAYDASVSISVWSGLLNFNVYQASDIVGCYRALSTLLSNPDSWLTPQNVDLAKRALIFQLVNERATNSDILVSLLRDTLRGFSIESGNEYYRLLERVNIDAVLKVEKTFFTRLIDPDIARVAIIQHGSMDEESVEKIINDFAKVGFEGFEGKRLHQDYLKVSNKQESREEYKEL